MSIDQVNVQNIIHNNIPCTKNKINNLIAIVNAREDMTVLEKTEVVQLLMHCIESTNGRTIEQKVQDLTEIIGNIACYSVANSLDFRKLESDITNVKDKVDAMDKRFDSMTEQFKQVAEQIVTKIDKLESNLDERIDKVEAKVQQNYTEFTSKIADLKAHNDYQDKQIEDQEDQPDKPENLVGSITQIALKHPWLIAFLGGITVAAIAGSERFVSFFTQLF